ncbi:hypothetical protein HanIR_Chr05g0209351 [Helianthus annuus]|nr:hypothetical protein HanIR_Chr05g0209351 [Helianthus annuus]
MLFIKRHFPNSSWSTTVWTSSIAESFLESYVLCSEFFIFTPQLCVVIAFVLSLI